MMIQKKANRDTTIEEIHRTRRCMADKFGGDIAAILEDARKRQAASGRAVWRRPSSNTAMPSTGDTSDAASLRYKVEQKPSRDR